MSNTPLTDAEMQLIEDIQKKLDFIEPSNYTLSYELMELIHSYTASQVRAARIDELKRIDPTQSLAVLTKNNADKPEWLNRRIAELQKEKDND